MKTVITMTSWTKRIHAVGKAIYRFLKTQTEKPDLFYLWLAEEEFPNKEGDLPQNLLLICEAFNIQICWTKDNEYCFKRWYVYPKHYEDLVISIDDDVIYDKNLIKLMKEFAKKETKAVVHYHGKGGLIEIKNGIEYLPSHKFIYKDVRNYIMCQCAFLPNSFPLDAWTDENIAIRKKICPKCDESWLHPFLIKNNIPIICFRTFTDEDASVQTVAIRNILHFDLVTINGKKYKRADLYKYLVLKKFPDLATAWKHVFPNYDLNKFGTMSIDKLLTFINK